MRGQSRVVILAPHEEEVLGAAEARDFIRAPFNSHDAPEVEPLNIVVDRSATAGGKRQKSDKKESSTIHWEKISSRLAYASSPVGSTPLGPIL